MFEMMKKKEAIVVRMECYLHNTRGQNVLQEDTSHTRPRAGPLCLEAGSPLPLAGRCWGGGAPEAGTDRRHRTMVTLCVVILGPWQLELETNLR